MIYTALMVIPAFRRAIEIFPSGASVPIEPDRPSFGVPIVVATSYDIATVGRAHGTSGDTECPSDRTTSCSIRKVSRGVADKAEDENAAMHTINAPTTKPCPVGADLGSEKLADRT
jgi:hypothetical protein